MNHKTLEPSADGSLFDTIKTILVAGFVALVVRSLAFEPFSIPSGSMIPTLLISDYLFVSKSAYGYSRFSFPLGLAPIVRRINGKPVERCDIAVFRKPTAKSIDYIKRTIGLPGDRIQMQGGRLYINGNMVERTFLGETNISMPDGTRRMHKRYRETLPGGCEHEIIEISDDGPLDNTDVYIVPKGHYFMMGDNRDGSQDSRVLDQVGYVPYENFVGRAERIFFSLNDYTPVWKLWRWPVDIRFSRLLKDLH
jgi:signal peptidase I